MSETWASDEEPSEVMASDEQRAVREPRFGYSALALGLVVAILLVGSLVFGAEIQLLLFLSMLALIPLVLRLGYTYEQAQNLAFDSMHRVLGLIMILVAVGTLIASWAASGTIPALVDIGLSILSPALFLPTVLVICSFASMATGTSWGTAGTIGVATMGVGEGMGYPAAMTAGAVLCGAYFGDKMSPFSDSTNLNAALVRASLTGHIRHVTWTTMPAIAGSAVIFTVLGFLVPHGTDATTPAAQQMAATLEANYSLGWPVYLPLVVTFTLLVLRKPALPSIFLGALAGAVLALVHQGQSVSSMLNILYSGYSLDSGITLVDDLVTGGGITAMLPLAALFLFAVGMAGLLSGSGMLTSFIRPALALITNRRRLMVVSIVLVPFLVALGGSFSFAAVMASSLLLPLYERFNLDPRNLSRILEDSGTANDAAFPWSGGGIFMAGVLGVATLDYLPFYFFVYLSMAMSLLYAVTGWKVSRTNREQ